ncbi:MAG: hypothetical protein HWE15_10880 [Algoriphagus sp.]|uniref:hypothetical protein n=1 Tax=Algoriphagus sp. TaxID=1872435 RepID=UPI001803A912|nr:hypothetical protein [Algoriphagus sp.]NVJ86800.1 hypothetical protein [Algoriphagus sp.]
MIGYGSFCDYFFTQKRFLDKTEKKQWVLSLEGGAYEYAVLGSSRAFGAFDMNLLDSLTGWNGINLGANGSGFKDNFLILDLFLKSNSIKKLFLQVDMASLNSDVAFSNEFHAFTFFPYWENENVRNVLIEEIPLLDNIGTKLFPQWRYFYFNKYYSPKEVLRKIRLIEVQENPFSILKGGAFRNGENIEESQIGISELPGVADSVDWNYLKKIIHLATIEGVEIVLFSAPRFFDSQEDLKNTLKQIDIPMLYPDEFPILNKAYFIDQGHLSKRGVDLFTIKFSKRVKEIWLSNF